MGEVASNQSEEIRRILLNRHLDNVFNGSGAPKRPGSAPPQSQVLPSSPLGTAPIGYNYITGEPLRGVGGGQQHGPPPPPTQQKFTENIELGITPDSEEALRSRPEYVAYYYAHVRNNPRLPPPLATRNLSPTWPENGKSLTSDGLMDTQAKPDGDAEAQATINILFGSQVTLKDGAEPIPIRGTNYLGQDFGRQVTSSLGAPSAISPSQCPDTLAAAWTNVGASAAASSAAQQLDALLGAFGSPKPSASINPLLTAELKAQASGVSLYSTRSVDEQALESLYAGSTPHTPLGSQHGGAAQLFNTFNADSPRPSSLDVIGRSVSSSSLGGGALGKDPKINPAPGPTGRLASVIGDQRATLRTPSKLRIGTTVVDPDPQQQLLDSLTGADSTAAAAAAVAAAAADPESAASALASVAQVQAAVEALQSLPPGAASAFAAALSGSDQAGMQVGGQPLVTPDVLLAGAGAQQQQQMQAMYMAAAAMYPVYYAQQAQQAAGVQHSIQAMQAMTGFPAVSSGGFPVMPASISPAMLQAAYPSAMIPGLPSGAAASLLSGGNAGLPGVMPEVALAAAGLRPSQPYATMNAGAHLAPSAFPPSMVVGATGGDYAAYYHKVLEAQAAAVAIAGNGKDVDAAVLRGNVPPPPPPHGQPPPPPKDNRRNSGGEVPVTGASSGTYGHPLSATEGDRRLRTTSSGHREMERMLSSRGSGNLGSSNGAGGTPIVSNVGGSPGVLNGSPSQTSHSSYNGVSPQQSQHNIHHHQANNSRLRSSSGSQPFLDSHVTGAASSGASGPLVSVSSGGPGGYSPRESRGQLEITIPRRNSRRDALAGASAVEGEGGHQASAGSGHGRGPRNSGDSLLDEFKSNKTGRKYELREILGHVYEFSLDQHGSRFIQQKLESIAPEDLDAAFAEVLPRILHLVTDVFGNYVVQKFLEHGTLEHRARLAKALHGHVLQLSLQMYGCRVVQKALEVFTEEQQVELVAELDGHIMRCVRDQNGNHVIQKCIECVPTPRIVGLLDNFLMCVVPLSTHPFGCRIIQRILEHVRDARRRASVMADILAAAVQLTQDQYGNYVIQHVLERGTAEERSSIASSLAPTVVQLSMHKFASNVIEKCLTYGSTADRDLLINRMLGAAALQMQAAAATAGAESDIEVEAMMKDQFGNYVVQKVLEVCTDEQREIMLARVRQQLHALKRFTYGKHIVARVEKLLSAGTRYQTHAKGRLLPDDEALAAAAAAGRLALGNASHSSSAAAQRPVEVPSAGMGYAAKNETTAAAGSAPDAPTTPPVSSSPSDSCYTGALAASTSTALPVHADSDVAGVDGEISGGVAVAMD